MIPYAYITIQTQEAAALIARIEYPKLQEQFRRIHFESPERIRAAHFDGQLAGIGFHTYSPGDKDKEISIMLYVLPAFRRRGVGLRLYQQLLDEVDSIANQVSTGALYDGECGDAVGFVERLGGALWYSMYDMEYSGPATQRCGSIYGYSDEYYPSVVRINRDAWRELAQKYGFKLSGEDDAHRLRLMQNSKNEYVYKIGGEVVAYCTIAADTIQGLIVDPLYQRRGVGRSMIEYGISLIMCNGFDRARLCVISDNPARRIYEAMGFKLVAFRSYYRLPAFLSS